MEARHMVSFLRSCGEPEMGEAVEQMNNRLEAFSLGMDRAAIDCAIRAAEELTAQRDGLLNAVRFLLSNPDNRISVADRNAAYAAIDRATGGGS